MPDHASGAVGQQAPPLAVDLDGTLLRTDLLLETTVALLRNHPLALLALPGWLFRGKAFLKAQVARRVTLDAAQLPYRRTVLEYLQTQRASGRHLVLATGADQQLAQQVAEQVGLFDSVFASDGRVNLSGEQKRRRLVSEFGEKGFDYIGNGRRDLAVCESARRAVLVHPTRALRRDASRLVDLERVLDQEPAVPFEYIRALRLHHWLKNFLVFAPVAAAHQITDVDLVTRAAIAFLAFGLCASSVYLLNDLMDLAADRHHPRKRDRPLAAGTLRLPAALVGIPGLLVASLTVSLALPPIFMAVLAVYYLLNIAYSLRLKYVVILDVLVLAVLYTLRIIAGSAAVGIWPSPWLLAFSMFLFFSLALVKRYAELMAMGAVEGPSAKARAYQIDDAELLAALGGGAGYVAVLVLALYINSETSRALYSRQELLWLVCVLLLYWISHLWLMAHRKRMHDDPLVFAVHNPVSRTLIVLMALVLMAAI